MTSTTQVPPLRRYYLGSLCFSHPPFHWSCCNSALNFSRIVAADLVCCIVSRVSFCKSEFLHGQIIIPESIGLMTGKCRLSEQGKFKFRWTPCSPADISYNILIVIIIKVLQGILPFLSSLSGSVPKPREESSSTHQGASNVNLP